MSKNFTKNKLNSGVTLIELLVVIVIFMIITSITIFNYGKFNSSISIQNLADDIALSIRKAQGYAIGVRGANDVFNNGYGVHFTINPLVVGKEYLASNESFVLFADLPDSGITNQKYDYGSGACGSTPLANQECMEVLNIVSADQISSITFTEGDNMTVVTGQSTLDILFKRPNPEPQFCYRINPSTTTCDSSTNITLVKLKISNIVNPDIQKIITISNNGLINVSNDGN